MHDGMKSIKNIVLFFSPHPSAQFDWGLNDELTKIWKMGWAKEINILDSFFVDLNVAVTGYLLTCTRPGSCRGRSRSVGRAPRRSWCRARPRRRARARAAGAGRTTPSSCSPSCGSAEEQNMRRTLSVVPAPCAPGWRCRCPGWPAPRAGPSSPRCCGQRSRRSCSRWSPSPPCRYVDIW